MRNVNKDDFLLVTTSFGNVLLKWKHNNRTTKLFKSGDCMKRAIKLRDFLTDWYAENHYQIDSEGHIEQS